MSFMVSAHQTPLHYRNDLIFIFLKNHQVLLANLKDNENN